jgi:DNA primase
LGSGFAAVGIPGAGNFKPEWAELFKNKRVFVAFDGDAAGDAGAVKVLSLLGNAGITGHRLPIPPGMDINAWLASGAGPKIPPGLLD